MGGWGGGGGNKACMSKSTKTAMYFQQKLYVAKATKSGMLSHTTCISTQTHANNAVLLWQKVAVLQLSLSKRVSGSVITATVAQTKSDTEKHSGALRLTGS